ncbi:hypothetical protein FOZ63_020919, partial [Perkinsus olseni]
RHVKDLPFHPSYFVVINIVLFAYTAVMVLSDSVTPTMIGDYPAGCNGGNGFPIPPHLHSIEGSCIYLTELGEYGTFELYWTVADPDAKPNVNSTGQVQLSL